MSPSLTTTIAQFQNCPSLIFLKLSLLTVQMTSYALKTKSMSYCALLIPPKAVVMSAHITIQELIPIVLVVALWGHSWAGKTVRALSHNMAVVHIINCKQSCNTDAMHLIRCLTLIECVYDFVVVSKPLPGKHNSIADALSYNQRSAFLSLYPQGPPLPTSVPSSLLQVVVCQKPDWICVNWATLFANIFNKA